MKKVIIILLSFLILFSFSSAIKISPTQQRLALDQFETKCVNIWVLPEMEYSIRSKWAFDGQGDINKYNQESKDIGMNLSHRYISDGKYELCLTPSKGGNISGIIYFYSEEDIVEIGSWIDLDIKRTSIGENIQNKINLISGNAIKEGRGIDLVLGGIFASLIGILLFVLIIKKR